jgi:hypothetical protein
MLHYSLLLPIFLYHSLYLSVIQSLHSPFLPPSPLRTDVSVNDRPKHATYQSSYVICIFFAFHDVCVVNDMKQVTSVYKFNLYDRHILHDQKQMFIIWYVQYTLEWKRRLKTYLSLPATNCSEGGGSRFIRNVGLYQPNCTTLQPDRPLPLDVRSSDCCCLVLKSF